MFGGVGKCEGIVLYRASFNLQSLICFWITTVASAFFFPVLNRSVTRYT